jgi:predicted DNA-binding transcriptional regulator AlpA
MEQPEPLAKLQAMMDILQISEPTLRRLLAAGDGPPHFYLGKQLRFPLGEMFDDWLRERVSDPHDVAESSRQLASS